MMLKDLNIDKNSREPVGALPARSSKAEVISNAMSLLSPGDWLFVDTNGNVSNNKTSYVTGQSEILFSIKALKNGSFEAYPALPPRNLTFVSSEESPDFGNMPSEHSLYHSVVINSGDWVSLSTKTNFRIPDKIKPTLDNQNEIDEIENYLANGKVGQSYEIGRSEFPTLPNIVSRIHVSIEILNRTEGSDGSLQLQARLWPGKPSNVKVQVSTGDKSLQPLTGGRKLSAGDEIECGKEIGVITVPFAKHSEFSQSQSVYNFFKESAEISANSLEGAKGFLNTIIKGDEHGQFSIDRMRVVRSYTSRTEAEKALKISMLDHYIREGIELVKEEKFSRAIKHFQNIAPLDALGYTFEENNQVGLHELTEQAIQKNLFMVAARSWFMPFQGKVYPSFGILMPGTEPKNEQEQDLLWRWQKELALIYAEEWTHALQDAAGGLISKKALLISGLSAANEADVALFFQEDGLSMSYHYIKERYAVRNFACQLVKGFQKPEEQAAIEYAYNSLPIGGQMAITSAGLAVQFGNNIMPVIAISGDIEGLSTNAEKWRKSAISKIEKSAVFIKKTDTGAPSLNLFKNVLAHIPDENGVYKQLRGEKVIEPGAPFYIEKCLRFTLG